MEGRKPNYSRGAGPRDPRMMWQPRTKRLATVSSLRGPGSQRVGKHACMALIFFLVVSTGAAWYGRNQRSGWLQSVGFPGDEASASLPLFGYNFLLGPQPLFAENAPFLGQICFFNGVSTDRDCWSDFYLNRPLYAFLASGFTPLVRGVNAFLLVNWLAWALCAWAGWRLSRKLFNDSLAALLTVILVSGGIGMMIHIGDYSAHLLAFATYYVGVYLLYDSGVLFKQQPWRTHWMLSVFFALACLVYGTGIILIGIYLLVAWRHNRWYQVAVTTLVPLAVRPLWVASLPYLGANLLLKDDTEMAILQVALQNWQNLFHESWFKFLTEAARRLGEFACFDSPIVVLGGVLSFWIFPQTKAARWFGLVVMVLPLMVSWIYSSNTDNRGYTIYEVSLWVYCLLGRLFARGLRDHRRWLRLAGWLALGIVIASHFTWATAHLWGWLGPSKAYLLGPEKAWCYFVHPHTEVLNMTGAERTPILFGGRSSLVRAGAYSRTAETQIEPSEVSWLTGLQRRASLWGLLVAFAALAIRSVRRRVLVIASLTGFLMLSAAHAQATFRTVPNYVDNTAAFAVEPGGKFEYRIALSPAFLSTLIEQTEQQDKLALFIPAWREWANTSCDPEGTVTANATSFSVSPEGFHWVLNDTQSALKDLAREGCVQINVTNTSDAPMNFFGWQRRDLPGRQIVSTSSKGISTEPPEILPAIEIRVWRPDGSLKLAGF